MKQTFIACVMLGAAATLAAQTAPTVDQILSLKRAGSPEISPDGRWVAYCSNESGQVEVYVAAFPPAAAGRKWLVSKGGGSQSRWRRDGKELYFLSSEGLIMAAAVNANGSSIEVRAAQPLFQARYPYPQYHAFDVAVDGQRFLVNTLVTPPGSPVIAH